MIAFKMDINKIVSFINLYAPHYQDKELLKECVKKHIEYKTAIILYDNPKEENIIAVCRWNIEDDTAHILDLIIAPQARKIGLIKFMLQQGLKMYPSVTQLKWQRSTRDDKVRVFSVYRLLKEKQLQEA